MPSSNLFLTKGVDVCRLQVRKSENQPKAPLFPCVPRSNSRGTWHTLNNGCDQRAQLDQRPLQAKTSTQTADRKWIISEDKWGTYTGLIWVVGCTCGTFSCFSMAFCSVNHLPSATIYSSPSRTATHSQTRPSRGTIRKSGRSRGPQRNKTVELKQWLLSFWILLGHAKILKYPGMSGSKLVASDWL